MAASSRTKDSVKSRNREIGRLGEAAAVNLLRDAGYRILEKNFLCRAGEIDIIAEHRGVIVFVEVKTRSPRAFLPPADAVDSAKQDQVRKAARFYLSSFRDAGELRFDVVSVWIDDTDKVIEISHSTNAFPA